MKIKRKVFKGWFDPKWDIMHGDACRSVFWWPAKATDKKFPVKITVEWKEK